ncbi:MAG TPA: MDR family MFS transporter [Limnochordales bacterium]
MSEVDPTLTQAESNAVGGPLTPRQVRLVFSGLMLGMLVAAINLTTVAPALPRIVAELGGMEHYSWVALGANLTSAVIVPAVGKLGDMFGRKPFYVGGLILLMAASVLSGTAQSFWWLVGARVVQGVAMGMLVPLSQAIIGDIAAPRERGKYQGLMGMAFGVASVSGPPLGGWITEHFSWRWIFFINLPVGFIALWFILRYMHLPVQRREARIDYVGFATLTLGLLAVLLATTWGGNQYPWGSAPVIGLYAAGALLLAAFVLTQRRSPEPVIPLYLWKNPVFASSSVASMALAMAMFGAIYYVPMFAQGVMGLGAASSGFVLIPLDLGIILVSAANGFLIAKTGQYKPQMLLGLPLVGLGFLALMQLGPDDTLPALLVRMVLIGAGIGSSMQTYTLAVQNAVPYRDMGVATSAVQFARSVGSTVGVALMGTILGTSLRDQLPRHLPPGLDAALILPSGGQGTGDVAALFDPRLLAALPPEAIDGIRAGLAAAYQPLFLAGIVFVAVSLLATLLLKPLPLQTKSPADLAQEATSRATARAGDPEMVITRRPEV